VPSQEEKTSPPFGGFATFFCGSLFLLGRAKKKHFRAAAKAQKEASHKREMGGRLLGLAALLLFAAVSLCGARAQVVTVGTAGDSQTLQGGLSLIRAGMNGESLVQLDRVVCVSLSCFFVPPEGRKEQLWGSTCLSCRRLSN
jgi:hypothetical protein